VLFAFMSANPADDPPLPNLVRWAAPRFMFRLYPRGLASHRRYRTTSAVPGREDEELRARSGRSLMSAGLEIELEGDHDSLLVRIDAV
jgi:hypothetical protein